MLILTIRSDKPEAEVGLYEDEKQLAYVVWQAHRALAETIHQRIDDILKSNNIALGQLGGIVAYKGPGSFTGLRIGLSVANALAYGLGIPIVGIEGEDGWVEKGLASLGSGKNHQAVMPEYGAPVHITSPKNNRYLSQKVVSYIQDCSSFWES